MEGLAGAWVRRAFAQGEACASAEWTVLPEVCYGHYFRPSGRGLGYQRFATDTFARGHDVSDSVPDDAHAPVVPTVLPAIRSPKPTSRKTLERGVAGEHRLADRRAVFLHHTAYVVKIKRFVKIGVRAARCRGFSGFFIL